MRFLHIQAAVTLVFLAAYPAVGRDVAVATTVEKRVAASSDDAEENTSGTVSVGSGDLELIHDSTDQTVGMRWLDLSIPQGATITNAYIQFKARESQSEVTNLTIQGQAADNPPKFVGTGNVSGRPRTAALATWAPVPWTAGQEGSAQKTPDLTAVVQEIVNRAGWASGNALVMIITGTGHRTAWSWDGDPAAAPLLHVEYVIGPPPDNPPIAQLSVTQLLTPPLTIVADGSGSTDTDVPPISTPIATYQFDFGDGSPPVITTAPSAVASHTYAAAGTYDVTLIATDTGNNPSAPVVQSFAVLAPGTITTVEKRTIASDDDAEETAAGAVSLTSTDLEMVNNGSNQTVGMRWTGIAIPHGAAITAAYVQFSAKESQSGATNLVLRAQAADDTAPFASSASNLSTRQRTASSVAWAPVLWNAGEAGAAQRSPDLTALVQEVVNRPGWASGNALAIIVTGTGRRTAWSYDGNASASPLLHIEFSNTPAPDLPPIARLSVSLLVDPLLGVSADASESTDIDATPIASYEFDFGDGTPPVVVAAPTATAQHAYAAPGIYTVRLTATDTGNQVSAPVTEVVSVGLANLAPNGAIDDPPTDVIVTVGQGVLIRGTGVDPEGHVPLGYLWEFGGGAPSQSVEDPGTIVFQTPGTYTLRFTVADSLGLADPTPATRTITVQMPATPDADEIHWTVIGQTSVTFDWRGGSDTIHFGPTTAYGQSVVATSPHPIPFSSPGPFREAKLTGLAENALYHYAIGNGPDHTFRTPPPRGGSGFRLVAQGDIGAAKDFAAVGPIQTQIAALAPNLVLMLGDLTYGNDEGQPAVDAHFNDMMAWSRDAAYQVVWGNHEWDKPWGDDLRNYKGRFDLPNPQSTPRSPSQGCCDEDWSWFDYGNVRFIGVPEPYPNDASSRTAPPIPGTSCGCLPADNVWNTQISGLPVHPKSNDWVNSIGANENLDVAFGPPTYGMPWVVTDPTTPKVPLTFSNHSGQSDPGPYPFRPTTPIEQSSGDKHALMIDRSDCRLYELYKADWHGGSPKAGDGAIFDLHSNALRPDGWTSADDAGLPIFPGLVRSDEILAGEIRHALRFTAAETDPVIGSHLWPARFEASYTGIPPDPTLPPMGARFRLKASFDISGYSAHAQVVLRALQRYGMMLADIGHDWTLGGTYDPIWTRSLMDELRTVPGNQFEAIDQSSLMIDPSSGQARQTTSGPSPFADWGAKAATIMDAAQADPNIRFIVTYGHRPAYSSGLHPGETDLPGILGTLAVAHSKYVLNLNGHSHDYERTHPQDGVVHVTAGTGGSSLETEPGPCPWTGGCPPPSWSAFRAMHHAVLELRFTDTTIEGIAYCGPAAAGSNDVTCAQGTILDSFTIPPTVPDAPPVLSAPTSVVVAEGGSITIPVTVSDPDSQAITILDADLAGLPPSAVATFQANPDHRNGTLTWTPGFDHAGTYTVTFTAGNALSVSAATTITVSNVDRAPVVTAPSSASADEGGLVTVDVTVADPDGDPISALGASGLPTGATFTPGAGNLTGTLTWTPGNDQAGIYPVTFTASNALVGVAHIDIVVGNVDRPPVVTAAPTVSAAEGALVSFDVQAADPDDDSIALLEAAGLPAGASFTPGPGNQSGSFAWTPGYAQAGTYAVTFTATNAQTSSTQTVITVGNTNRPPTAALTASPRTGNAPLLVALSAATAADPDGPIASYAFDHGDGSSSGLLTDAWTNHSFGRGHWIAKVNVADSEAVEDSATIEIIVGEVADPNLALNGSFESSADGWAGVGGASFQTVAGGFDGGQSARVTGPQAATPFGIVDEPGWIPVLPVSGARYGVSVWVRSNAGTGMVQLSISEFLDDVPVGSSVATAPVALSTTWQELRTTFISCCAGSRIHVQIVDAPAQEGEEFEVDNVSIGAEGITGIDDEAPVATGESRAWIAPVPLRESGMLRFVNGRAGLVTVALFDIRGRVVRKLLDRQWVPAGRHGVPLDGRDERGERLPSGVYLYRASLPGRVMTGRLLIVR